MKKVIIMLALVISASTLMSQTKERTNAFMYNKNGQYDKAREAIDKAILNEKTINDPKTWMYRGIIYLNIVFSEQYSSLDPQALDKSLESFKKTLELDPEDKAKQKDEIIPRIDAISIRFSNAGAEAFNNQDYELATKDFKKAYDVALLVSKVDTISLLNAGLSSLRGEKFEDAIGYYNQLLEIGFNEPDVYRSLAASHRGLHQNDEMLAALNKGRKLYPNDSGLMLEEINAYLAMGQGAKVVDDLKNLVFQDSTNYSIYFVLGTIYGDETNAEMYNMDTAIGYYEKSLALNPEYYDAVYNLGALYINESNKLQVKANDLPLSETKAYDKITEEANEIIRKALPHLEKAYALQPENQETIQVLKSIYVRFKMDDKLKQINEQ